MSDTQQIKDNIDIVDFISEYVDLKPAGKNHKGLCPFHNEKSPSFMVSRERQSWRCFGCNKGGDVFTFLQDLENLEFVEALKFLADKAGVTLDTQFSGKNKAIGEKKVRLKEVMKAAVHFYHQFFLKMEAAAEARKYIEDRELKEYTIDVWKIGYVPEQWDLLTKYLLKKGFSIDDLIDAGLTIERDGANKATGRGYYDRFRDRIMFPICDAQGTPVGFTGRVLKETEKSGGKYVNTPQTEIYDKSNILYGMDKAKKAIRDHDQIIVVEGQMDVISVWQSGMEHVVASSGTALTEKQITLMKRYTRNIAMAFDTDIAGFAAAKRGIGIALEQGMHVKIIQIPEEIAKDPDECIKKNPAVWQHAVEEANDVLAWYIKRAMSTNDARDPEGKQRIADEVLPEIARIPSAVKKDHWLGELSLQLQIDRSVLKEDLDRIEQKQKKQVKKRVPIANNTQTTIPNKPKVYSVLNALVQEWLALVLAFDDVTIAEFPNLQSTESVSKEMATLYESVKLVYTKQHTLSVEKIETPELSETISHVVLLGEHNFGTVSKKERQEILLQLQDRMTQKDREIHRSGLIQALALAEENGDTEKVTEILSKLQ